MAGRSRALELAGTGIEGSGSGGTVGLGYQEQPTITYSPLIGQQFAQRMLTPIPLESIMLFEQGGWSAFITGWVGTDHMSPPAHIALRGNGDQASSWPGWCVSPDLERLRNAVGRVESSWRPASADEGFETLSRAVFDRISGVSGCIVVLLAWDERRQAFVKYE